MKLGIDLGTTHTVVACADRGNYPVIGFLDPDGDSVDWFPSVIAARGDELRFGFDALATDDSWEVLRSFKRLYGAHQAHVHLGGRERSLADLTAGFLEALRRAILERSNFPGDKLDETAVAVPANAHGAQRFLTLDAFRRAGFEVVALVNEPSAAAFEYTHRFRDTVTSRRDHLLVYDLGGGTFDASLLRMTEAQHEVLATSGLSRLGGDDFDALLAGLVSPRAPSAALLDRCRDAKERLTPQAKKLTVELDDGRPVTLPVADYYAACEPLIARTLAACEPLLADSESTLAGLYVVGGASELPPVGRLLRERFGRRVHRSPYPFAAVAIGLAIAAEGRFQLDDRLSRHMGVFREADAGRDIAFDAIFDPAAPLGTDLVRTYQAAHNLGHFRFVECSALGPRGPAGDITPLGDVLFPFDPALRGRALQEIPVERLRAVGPVVEERYAIDPEGLVRVTITDLTSGYRQEHCLGSRSPA
jgi:molecular chaperone DnaK (HSP70)